MTELGLPFDFRLGLPTGLVLAKPVEQGDYNPSLLSSEPSGKQLIATRKWNGWRLIATFTQGSDAEGAQDIRIFNDGSRKDGTRKRVDPYLPHIVNDLRKLNVPPWTILVAEAIAQRSDTERLGAVGSILQMSDPISAISRQEREGRLKLVLHGALCWYDQWLTDTHYHEVLTRLINLAQPGRQDNWVHSVVTEPGTVGDVQNRVRKYEWEGLVLHNPSYRFTWRLDGPNVPNPRPDGSYKWKPQQDGDFIISEPRMSLKRKGRIKDVMLMQYAPNGRLFRCGRIGNFSAKIDAELQNCGFTAVLEIRFDGRTPSGKLVNPRFIRIRDDKRKSQCVSTRSFDKAEYLS